MAEQKKIHPNFLKHPDLVEQRDRALNAIIEYDKVGSVRCTNRSYGPWQLCVDVKDRKMRNCAPEIREDKKQEFYDNQVRDFWELDFDGDGIAPDKCVHQFPEFFSEGRSGGYFVFDGTESKRAGPAFSEFNRKGSWYGGTQEPTDDGTLESALCAFDDTIDPYRWIEDVQEFDNEEKRKAWIEEDVANVTAVYSHMADVFESATEWAKVVLAQMEYRGDNYEGKNFYELDMMLENEMFDFFDFTSVHVEIEGEECTVSWPQHARQFKDKGDWVECTKETEGASEWRDGTYHKWITPVDPICLSVKMSRDQLVKVLSEELYASVKAIRKLALTGKLTKEK